MRYYNQNNQPKKITKIRFKFLFPNYETFKEKISLYDVSLDYDEKLIRKLIAVFGNHYLRFDSEDDNIAYVGMVYEECLYDYQLALKFNNIEFNKLVSNFAKSEGETYNPKNLKREDLDNSFLALYERSRGENTNYLQAYNYIKDNFKKAETTFLDHMRRVLYPNENYIIDRKEGA